jgi:hypothetical protein
MSDLRSSDCLKTLSAIDAAETRSASNNTDRLALSHCVKRLLDWCLELRQRAVELDLASEVEREVADVATNPWTPVVEWTSPDIAHLGLAGRFIDAMSRDLVDVTAIVLPLGGDRELAGRFLNATPEHQEGGTVNLVGHG